MAMYNAGGSDGGRGILSGTAGGGQSRPVAAAAASGGSHRDRRTLLTESNTLLQQLAECVRLHRLHRAHSSCCWCCYCCCSSATCWCGVLLQTGERPCEGDGVAEGEAAVCH
jgi:hypothetical protein